MKTPDEIKKGLFCGSGNPVPCCECAYCNTRGCNEEADADAIDYIEQLEAQVPRWIPVEERLPPNDDAVLIIVHNKSDAWTSVMIDVWVGGVWLDNADDDWHIVTHWMPLPEPPKEGTE